MEIQVWQAALFGLLACLASMTVLGGTVFGNYTLGRLLVAGLVVGAIMGDIQTGIYLGAAIQVVYIALVTPGGTALQEGVFDAIFPKMLPMVVVLFCYWLMSKKKLAPTTVMLVLVVVALIGVLLGFFDPQLSY